MDLSDSLPGRPTVMHSHGALVAFAPARQGLPGSSANLSTRAVPNHPGRSDDCIRLLLRHRSCLASSKSGGLATFVFLSRPNRVHLRYGSRVHLASPPTPLLELALARLRAEQAIYTMNSFQFIRSARLILAYPTNGRRHIGSVQSEVQRLPFFHCESECVERPGAGSKILPIKTSIVVCQAGLSFVVCGSTL